MTSMSVAALNFLSLALFLVSGIKKSWAVFWLGVAAYAAAWTIMIATGPALLP